MDQSKAHCSTHHPPHCPEPPTLPLLDGEARPNVEFFDFSSKKPPKGGRVMTQKHELLIDDTRHIDGAHIVRTYNDGIAALASQKWDILYLDHDLADFSGPDGREMTGYDVMCWIEANPEHLPGKIIIVSSNASGRPRMQMVINKLYGRAY